MKLMIFSEILRHIQTNNLIPTRTPDQVLINKRKKKRTCHLVDFVVSVDQRLKIKKSGKIDKYLDLAWELRKLRNIREIVIPIVIDALEMIPKCLEKGIRTSGNLEESKPSKLQQSWDRSEYWKEFWRPEKICCHSVSYKIPFAKSKIKLTTTLSTKENDWLCARPSTKVIDSL